MNRVKTWLRSEEARWFFRGFFVGYALALVLVVVDTASAVTLSEAGRVTGSGYPSVVTGLVLFAPESSDLASLDEQRDEAMGSSMPGFVTGGVNYTDALGSVAVTDGVEAFIIGAEAVGVHKWSGSAYAKDDGLSNKIWSGYKSSSSFGGGPAITCDAYGYINNLNAPYVTGQSSYSATRSAAWTQSGYGGALLVGQRVPTGWRVTAFTGSGLYGSDIAGGVSRAVSTYSTTQIQAMDAYASGGQNTQETAPSPATRVPYTVVARQRLSCGYAFVTSEEATAVILALNKVTGQSLSSSVGQYQSDLASDTGSAGALESELPAVDNPSDLKAYLDNLWASFRADAEKMRGLFWFLSPAEDW